MIEGGNILGNKLKHHVARSDKSLLVYSTGELLWKVLFPQENFAAATSRTISNPTKFVRLVAAPKFCCWEKDFHKNCPVHTKQFVAATCRATCSRNLGRSHTQKVICRRGVCCSDMLFCVSRSYFMPCEQAACKNQLNSFSLVTIKRDSSAKSRPWDKEGAVSKKNFSALRASVWSKNKGGPPLDQPLDS